MERIRRSLMQTDLDYANDAAMLEASMRPPTKRKSPHLAVIRMSRTLRPTPPVDVLPKISSKDWTLQSLLNRGNFKHVRRVSALLPHKTLLSELERYEIEGVPLIIEDWHKHQNWPKELFNMDWLLKHCGDHEWRVRNVRNVSDKVITLEKFIQWSRKRVLRGQSEDTEEELLYGKDAPCPPQWRDWVASDEILPSVLRPNGPTDLFQNLTESEGVESLMCYLGIGDTFTPCHKDLCASSGQNIMCYTEEGGSSFWFMTASSDAPAAGEFFQKQIGRELDWEEHTVTVDEFAAAPFSVYVAEQKLGDLVLVPPRSCHQVVNHGGLTVKTSWSRMTLRGLQTAFHHELPIYRRVCRPEQYRVKYILYRTLLQRAVQIKALQSVAQSLDHSWNAPYPPNIGPMPSLSTHMTAAMSLTAFAEPNGHLGDDISRLAKDLAELIDMFDLVLYEEYSLAHRKLPTILSRATSPTESSCADLSAIFNVRTPSKRKLKPTQKASQATEPESLANFCCDFCGADIFQSYFECGNDCRPLNARDDIGDGPEEPQLGDGSMVCSLCYIEGRTCGCGNMEPGQCRPFSGLLRDRNEAAALLSVIQAAGPRYSELLESDFQECTQLKIFEAACKLQQMRGERSAVPGYKKRKCKCGYNGPTFEVFYCKPCHGSKCLRDLLNSGIHAAEALLKFKGGGEDWHKMHIGVKTDFKGSISDLQAAERTGEAIQRNNRLVFVAQRYMACKPLNTDTRRGWYDEPDHDRDHNNDHNNGNGNDSGHNSNSDDDHIGISDVTAGGLAVCRASKAVRRYRKHQATPLRPSSATTMTSAIQEEGIVVVGRDKVDQPSTAAGNAQSAESSPLSVLKTSSESPASTRSFKQLSSTRQEVYVCVPLPAMKTRTSLSSTRTSPNISSKNRSSVQSGNLIETEANDDPHTAATQLVDALNSANDARASIVGKLAIRVKGRRIVSESPERPHTNAKGSPPPSKRRKVSKKLVSARAQTERPAVSEAGSSHNVPCRRPASKSVIRGARGRPPGRTAASAAPQEIAAVSTIASEIASTRSLGPVAIPSPSIPHAVRSSSTARAAMFPQTEPATAEPQSDVPLIGRLPNPMLSFHRVNTASPVSPADITPSITPLGDAGSSITACSEATLPAVPVAESRPSAPSVTQSAIVEPPLPSIEPMLASELSRIVEDVLRQATGALSRRVTELEETNLRYGRRFSEQELRLDRFGDLEEKLHDANRRIREQDSLLGGANCKAQEQENRANALLAANEKLERRVKEQDVQLQELKVCKTQSEERARTMEFRMADLERQVKRHMENAQEIQGAEAERISARVGSVADALADVVQSIRHCSEQYIRAADTPAEATRDEGDFVAQSMSPRTPSISLPLPRATTPVRNGAMAREGDERRSQHYGAENNENMPHFHHLPPDQIQQKAEVFRSAHHGGRHDFHPARGSRRGRYNHVSPRSHSLHDPSGRTDVHRARSMPSAPRQHHYGANGPRSHWNNKPDRQDSGNGYYSQQ